MNCKKCGSKIEDQAKFCPYCGEKVESNRDYQDPFAAYREPDSHQDQYQYQNQYSNSKENPNVSHPVQYQNQQAYSNVGIQYASGGSEIIEKKNHMCLIALILAILAVPACFIHCALGIVFTVVAFILCLVGFKHTTKGMRVISLIFSILSLVIVSITSVFIFVGSITIVLDNGYRTTISNYFQSAFFNGYHNHRIYGSWTDNAGELFYLSEEDGSYYLYLDRNETDNNYYTGRIQVDLGYQIPGGDDTLFADDDYYYYGVVTSINTSFLEGIQSTETLDAFANGFVLKLDKNNYNHMIFWMEDSGGIIEFTRYNQGTV